MSEETQGLTHYSMIIEWSEEDECFIATVPELPGCMTDGETREEAATHGEEAIKAWLDTAKKLGRSLPDPQARHS